MKEYKTIIGLEVHVELKTNSKMFCSCKNDSEEKQANFNVCPVCTAQPGTLPVVNKQAVRDVIKTGVALNCEIPFTSKFDRKNYFYPDLPKGYQISQYDMPLCKGGYLVISGKKIRITRVHLEEDTGRLIHPEGVDYSLVDYNRAGIPLMELVTEPDIETGKQAKEFAEDLQLILKYLGVSFADMEKGQMRVEVNISQIKGDKNYPKVEIKNLNSFRVVERSIDYEIERQRKAIEDGEKMIQETRGWDDTKGKTFSQREKEEAHDYRYFPEPDIPTMSFDQEFIDDIKKEIPELPANKRERFEKEYGLEKSFSDIFVFNRDLGEYFEKVISEIGDNKPLIKTIANYLITDLLGLLKGKDFIEKACKITPENFAEFILMIKEGKITSKTAKQVLLIMFEKGSDPSHIIDEGGLSQIEDEEELRKIVENVVKDNPTAVNDYKQGKLNSFQFLIGKAIAKTRGTANPEIIKKLLSEILSN